MPQLDHQALQAHINEIERIRDSRVLVLAAVNLDMELLPALYEQCRELGHGERLDVVLHGRGGVVNAARRIALLLRERAGHLAFIVPFHCESAATLLTLCADEIVAFDLALFSPIDPQLNGTDGTAFSSLDIERFGAMAAQWFGIDQDSARAESLGLLCNSVFPPSLTAFHRTTLELAQIADELLRCSGRHPDAAQRERIVQQLMAGYHSHNYAITPAELAALGLPVRRDDGIEAAAWAISRLLQDSFGGGVRASVDEPWTDALLATRAGIARRTSRPSGLAPTWARQQFA